MKKFFIFSTFLFLSSPALADMDLSVCKGEGERHDALQQIPMECSDIIWAYVDDRTKRASVDGLLIAYGKKNILVIREFQKDENGKDIIINRFITGPKSRLSDILSVDLSFDKKKIVVVNQHGGKKEVLTFLSARSGNVVPIRVLNGDEFENASMARFSSDGNQILVSFPNQSTVVSYPAQGDSRSKRASDTTLPRFRLTSGDGQLYSPTDALRDSEGKVTYVIDNKRLLLFADGSKSPFQVIGDGSGTTEYPVLLALGEDVVYILNSDDSVMTIPRNPN